MTGILGEVRPAAEARGHREAALLADEIEEGRLQGEARGGDGVEVAPEMLEGPRDGIGAGGSGVVDLAEALGGAFERGAAGGDVLARKGRQRGGFAHAVAACRRR